MDGSMNREMSPLIPPKYTLDSVDTASVPRLMTGCFILGGRRIEFIHLHGFD